VQSVQVVEVATCNSGTAEFFLFSLFFVSTDCLHIVGLSYSPLPSDGEG
jgi:hypothetical protein